MQKNKSATSTLDTRALAGQCALAALKNCTNIPQARKEIETVNFSQLNEKLGGAEKESDWRQAK
ncbi:MAG: hypothetical protein KGJ13_08890, partial [Patescibacteria group bacterium]|nr:hypothetical protein [Patescibacteria group bacterium]